MLNDAHMRQLTVSPLVQKLDFRLFGTKPQPVPVIALIVGPLETNIRQLLITAQKFLSKEVQMEIPSAILFWPPSVNICSHFTNCHLQVNRRNHLNIRTKHS